MQLLKRAVLNQAQTDADQVLDSARTKADAIRQRAQEQAKSVRQEILARAKKEAEQVRSERVAAAELEARTLRLKRREALLDEVFEAVRERLPTIQQWTDYDEIVRDLTREAVRQLGAQAVRLRVDERARDMMADGALTELSTQLGVELQLEPLGGDRIGIVAETMDGHRRYDNTLQARLDRWQDVLRAPVFRLLRGESL
jgi:V/A-type H+-transporting ATPase subunit E